MDSAVRSTWTMATSLDEVVKMGLRNGIWYVDKTRKPGPSKQRNPYQHPEEQQAILNMRRWENVRRFYMQDHNGYQASFNLDAMEQDSWHYTRYLELRDRCGRVVFSWDIINAGVKEYDDERVHFDNLPCYLYYTQFHKQLKQEFTDPAALQ